MGTLRVWWLDGSCTVSHWYSQTSAAEALVWSDGMVIHWQWRGDR